MKVRYNIHSSIVRGSIRHTYERYIPDEEYELLVSGNHEDYGSLEDYLNDTCDDTCDDDFIEEECEDLEWDTTTLENYETFSDYYHEGIKTFQDSVERGLFVEDTPIRKIIHISLDKVG